MGLSLSLFGCQTGQVYTTENVTMKTEIPMQRIKNLSSEAPIAKRVEKTRTFHGKELKDSYFWLKDQDYPKTEDEDVLNYLKADFRRIQKSYG